MTRLFVCAGEASGDRLGAALATEILAREPGAVLAGLVGPAMRAAGVIPIADIGDIGVVGLGEAVGAIPRVVRLLRRLDRAIDAFRPDVVVTIDAPSLMLRLARRIRGRGHRVAHWVSPQVWAWRKNRIPRVAASVDLLLCLFPFEPALYAGTGLQTAFTGHPSVDRLLPFAREADPAPVFGLVPGSRRAEIDQLWPVFCDVAARVVEKVPGARFVVPVAPTVRRERLANPGVTLVDDIRALAGVRAALVCSGTATLELAALGVPMVVAYKTQRLTYEIGRRVLEVPYLALPNVLAGKRIVPEFIQQLPVDAMAEALVHAGGQREQLLAAVLPLAQGASARAADEILAFIGRNR